MSQYNTYPGVDSDYQFPPVVRQAMANSTEVKASINVELETKVEPLVAEYIASDPAIVDAAAAAVDANPKIKSIEGDIQTIESTMVTAGMNLEDALVIQDELGNEVTRISELSGYQYLGTTPTPYSEQNNEDSFIIRDENGMQIIAFDDLSGTPHIRGGGEAGFTETHFIAMLGQSNSQATASAPSPLGTNDPVPNLFTIPQRGSDFGKEIIATDPLAHPYSNSVPNTAGHGWAVARDYALKNPRVRVVIIPLAMSGSGFFHSASPSYTWAPSRVGEAGMFNLYSEAILRLNTDIRKYSGTRRLALCIWHQGEADAVGNTTQAQYENELKLLIEGIRQNVDFAADAPFIIGQTGWEFRNVRMPGTYAQIDLAHKNMPNLVRRTAFAEAPPQGYMNSDNTHFTAYGQKLLAANMISKVMQALYNV